MSEIKILNSHEIRRGGDFHYIGIWANRQLSVMALGEAPPPPPHII